MPRFLAKVWRTRREIQDVEVDAENQEVAEERARTEANEGPDEAWESEDILDDGVLSVEEI